LELRADLDYLPSDQAEADAERAREHFTIQEPWLGAYRHGAFGEVLKDLLVSGPGFALLLARIERKEGSFVARLLAKVARGISAYAGLLDDQTVAFVRQWPECINNAFGLRESWSREDTLRLLVLEPRPDEDAESVLSRATSLASTVMPSTDYVAIQGFGGGLRAARRRLDPHELALDSLARGDGNALVAFELTEERAILELGGAATYDLLRDQLVAEVESECEEAERMAVDRERYVLLLTAAGRASKFSEAVIGRFSRRSPETVRGIEPTAARDRVISVM